MSFFVGGGHLKTAMLRAPQMAAIYMENKSHMLTRFELSWLGLDFLLFTALLLTGQMILDKWGWLTLANISGSVNKSQTLESQNG